MKEYSYIGKGKVYLAKREDNKLRYVGNCDKVELSISEETKELKDFANSGGGVVNSVSRVDKLEIALNLFDYSPANLAMALYGEASTVEAGKAVTEEHVAYRNHLVKLQHSHIKHVTVKSTKADIIFQQGTDYDVVSAGIIILESSKIKDGEKLLIDYEYSGSDIIHALVNSGYEYHLVFDGLNEAQSGKKVVLDLYRVKFTPASSLSLIGDDFASLELKGTALVDTSKVGTGISRYFKVEMEQLNA
ncbi:MAG: hypothetical protein AB7I18_11075 [Candidatus Berkiella sp.]